MDILVIILAIFVCVFGFVLLFGAPYLPSLKQPTLEALKAANLQRSDRFIELGCGDGRVLVAAAAAGCREVVGYELNPLLWLVSYVRTWRNKNIKVRLGNFWGVSLANFEVVFTFLLPKYMPKLDKKIIQEKTGNVKLISIAFAVPEKKALMTGKGYYLYIYK